MGYAAPLVLSSPNLSRQLNSTERLLAFAAFALTILSLFSGLFIHRFLPVIADKRTRTRVQLAASVPACARLVVFMRIFLPRLEFTVSQLLVATLWALAPLGVLGGFIFGLDEAVRRKLSAAGA